MIFLLVERHIDRVIETLLLGRVVVERLHHDALYMIEEERVEHERHFNTIRSEPGKDRFVVEGIAHVGKVPRIERSFDRLSQRDLLTIGNELNIFQVFRHDEFFISQWTVAFIAMMNS